MTLRVLAVCAIMLALAGAGGLRASASAASTVACPHLHLVYSFAPGTAAAVSVSGSVCSIDGSASASTSGGGSLTLVGPEASPACATGAPVQCATVALSLTTGAAEAAPTFTVAGPVAFEAVSAGAPLISSSTFDYDAEGTIIGFSQGVGSGALNSICTYAGGIETCTADGAFAWEPDPTL